MAEHEQWSSTSGVTVSDSDGSTAAGVPSIQIATDGSFSSSLGEEDTEITADNTVQPDTTDVAQFEVKLLEDQHATLSQVGGGAGGFWGSSGGGNPLTSL